MSDQDKKDLMVAMLAAALAGQESDPFKAALKFKNLRHSLSKLDLSPLDPEDKDAAKAFMAQKPQGFLYLPGVSPER